MEIYDKTRKVPESALKTIIGGRLKGKSDINPIWRIKTLTECFGPCGFGWKYKITDKRLEKGENEISAFVDIELYVKWNGEWSEAIPGTGGSSFLSQEKSNLYQSDECFKMALTDAISVACKALGIAADVYWNSDTKYTQQVPQQDTQQCTSANNVDDIKKKIRDMIIELHGKDEYAKKLNEYTSFKSNNGEIVSGVDTLEKLTDKRVYATYGKIKTKMNELKKNAG
jgi:hypothetical protein